MEGEDVGGRQPGRRRVASSKLHADSMQIDSSGKAGQKVKEGWRGHRGEEENDDDDEEENEDVDARRDGHLDADPVGAHGTRALNGKRQP
eukprot:3925159-Pyramimonas_sp.AAC.1